MFLKQKAKIPLTRSLYLYCLEFVLAHRLAPLWNKIDKYFIQGRDFLAEENKISAIRKFKVVVNINAEARN